LRAPPRPTGRHPAVPAAPAAPTQDAAGHGGPAPAGGQRRQERHQINVYGDTTRQVSAMTAQPEASPGTGAGTGAGANVSRQADPPCPAAPLPTCPCCVMKALASRRPMDTPATEGSSAIRLLLSASHRADAARVRLNCCTDSAYRCCCAAPAAPLARSEPPPAPAAPAKPGCSCSCSGSCCGRPKRAFSTACSRLYRCMLVSRSDKRWRSMPASGTPSRRGPRGVDIISQSAAGRAKGQARKGQ
jgi:hypothetical protein